MKKKFLFIIFCIICLLYANEIPQIKLVTVEWIPYYSNNLPEKGFITEIVQESFLNSDYKLKVHFTEWVKALKIAKTGKYDGLMGLTYSNKRGKDFHYSLPIFKTKDIFLSKKNLKVEYDGNLKSLKNYRIGVSKDYFYNENFAKANFLNKIEAKGPNQLFDLILSDKVDLIVMNSRVADYLLKKRFKNKKSNLKVISSPLGENYLFIALSKNKKNYKKIIKDFNNGFTLLVKQGRVKEILKKHKMRIK